MQLQSGQRHACPCTLAKGRGHHTFRVQRKRRSHSTAPVVGTQRHKDGFVEEWWSPHRLQALSPNGPCFLTTPDKPGPARRHSTAPPAGGQPRSTVPSFRGPVADRSEVIWDGKHAAPPGNTTRVRGVARLGSADWTSGSRFLLALRRLRRSAVGHTRRPSVRSSRRRPGRRPPGWGALGPGGRTSGAMGAAGRPQRPRFTEEEPLRREARAGHGRPGVGGRGMRHGGARAGASAAPAGPGGASGVDGSP